MSNKQEPVAWVRAHQEYFDGIKDGVHHEYVDADCMPDDKTGWIPLYTHPMCELSVDEIRTCSMEAWDACSGDDDNDYDIVFARAVIAAAKGSE